MKNVLYNQNTINCFTALFVLLFISMYSCSETATHEENPAPEKFTADVISVEVAGEPMNYIFSVEIQSPDTGCGQYADWWEVLSEENSLIYRRILLHSHVNEQPFLRSGGPVPVTVDEIVYVRGHMHPDGYGGTVFKGSVQNGFEEAKVPSDFASEVENEPPQPEGCAF